MSKFSKPLIISTVVALLSGCASGILQVDQDRYNNGDSLQYFQNSIILGPPEGDSFGLIVPPAFVTDDTPGDMGRAVRIGDRIEFNTVKNHSVPDRYLITWTGTRQSQGQAITDIILRDDAGHEAFRVHYQLNDIDIIWGDDVGLVPATQPQLPHEIRITLHMKGANVAADIMITRNDEVIMDRKNLDLIDREFSRLDVIEVRTQTNYDMKNLVAITLND